jgi:predicted nucleic acid-binding protein
VLGILIEAKHKVILQAITPQMEALRDIAGFHVSAALFQRILQDAGEI